MNLTRALYSVLMVAAQPLLRRKLRRRGKKEPGYLAAVEERFGFYDVPPPPDDGLTIWVHAVSLGETNAAALLLKALRERYPRHRLLLTNGTSTGRAAGKALLQEGDAQVWLPWDTPAAVQRFIAHFKPCLGVLMETEIWPNLVAGCAQANIPLVLANGRMSEKTLRNTLRLAWLARPVYRRLAAVFAQTQDDAERFGQLGAKVAGVFGNLKFDAAPDEALLAQGRAWRASLNKPVVTFASSREGEEALLLEAIKALGDGVHWLIVPRHPQRFDEVKALVEAAGRRVSCRSEWRGGGPSEQQGLGEEIWLGDTLGEMALYYGLSDAVLLGGSFAPLGGQNLIEAAACACPVFMGPHTFNFAAAAELAEHEGAAMRCMDVADAATQALALTQAPDRQQATARSASRFAQSHRGAVARTVKALAAYLD